mmetsp:Transcript_5222/g.7983  ORF Transcript_5222/g.7983 Transcript_5222/m.7983 type:complete len:211 (+) Transcript_5222:572-1204(+)
MEVIGSMPSSSWVFLIFENFRCLRIRTFHSAKVHWFPERRVCGQFSISIIVFKTTCFHSVRLSAITILSLDWLVQINISNSINAFANNHIRVIPSPPLCDTVWRRFKNDRRCNPLGGFATLSWTKLRNITCLHGKEKITRIHFIQVGNDAKIFLRHAVLLPDFRDVLSLELFHISAIDFTFISFLIKIQINRYLCTWTIDSRGDHYIMIQ